MRIGIDIDEILVDFLHPFLDYHNRTYGTSYRWDDFKTFGLQYTMQESQETLNQRVDEFNHTDEFAAATPVAGAIEAVDVLAAAHELVIVSSRPDNFHDKTRQWVEQYFPGKFSEFLFTSHPYAPRGSTQRKADMCIAAKLNVLIEDALEHVLPCAEAGITVLLWDTPWNRVPVPDNVIRVRSWPEIVDTINRLPLY
jgi:uncharacterized HAD superfamily protein